MPGVVLDLSGQAEITKLLLRPSIVFPHNNPGGSYSIKDFRVDVSSDMYTWKSLSYGLFPQITFEWKCTTAFIPMHEIVIPELVIGRYLIFTPLTSYHSGDAFALKYFGAETSQLSPYFDKSQIEAIPASEWVGWIYEITTETSLDDCLTACQDSVTNTCDLVIYEGTSCHLANPRETHHGELTSSDAKTGIVLTKESCPRYELESQAHTIYDFEGLYHDECDFSSWIFEMIDLQCMAVIKAVLVRNSQNFDEANKGAKLLRFEISRTSGGTFTPLATSDVLPNPKFVPCSELPLIRIPVSQFSIGRYVKVYDDDRYGTAFALQYLGFDTGK